MTSLTEYSYYMKLGLTIYTILYFFYLGISSKLDMVDTVKFVIFVAIIMAIAIIMAFALVGFNVSLVDYFKMIAFEVLWILFMMLTGAAIGRITINLMIRWEK